MVSNHPSGQDDAAGKNFNLRPTEFDQMAKELKLGNDQLFQKCILQHFPDCTAYLKRKFRATPTEAYDATVDTLVEFAKKIRQGKIQYGNLRFLFTKMASQLFNTAAKKGQVFCRN